MTILTAAERISALTSAEMAKPPGIDLIAARPTDADRLALLSRAAKASYREWAEPGWEPPSAATERARWERRLADPAGWTLIAAESDDAHGAIHFTDARTERGEGEAILGRAHVSGLFVLPERWREGIGGALLEAAVERMTNRGYRSAQVFTGTANGRSQSFYQRRGWQLRATNTHRHDHLWHARYELRLTKG